MTTFHRPPCIKANGKPKRRYPSFAAVKVALRNTRRGNLRDARAVHAYRCTDCGFFHVGHYDREEAA